MIRLIFSLSFALISFLVEPAFACPSNKAPAVSCQVHGGDQVKAYLRGGKLYIEVRHGQGIGTAKIELLKSASAIKIRFCEFARLEGFTAGSGSLQFEKIESNTRQRQFNFSLNPDVKFIELAWVDSYR